MIESDIWYNMRCSVKTPITWFFSKEKITFTLEEIAIKHVVVWSGHVDDPELFVWSGHVDDPENCNDALLYMTVYDFTVLLYVTFYNNQS